MAIVKTKKPDLNIHYKRYFQISMILTLFLLIAAFKFSPKSSNPAPINVDDIVWLDIEDIIKTNQITEPLTSPKPPVPQIATNDVIDDNIFDATDIDFEATMSAPPKLEKPLIRILEEEQIPFYAVQVKPELIGGLESILKNVYYPEIAKRACIEGRVSIGFTVNKSGEVEDAKVIKGVLEQLDTIALNAVKQAKFSPGMQRGKPVKVIMVIPILFKLQ